MCKHLWTTVVAGALLFVSAFLDNVGALINIHQSERTAGERQLMIFSLLAAFITVHVSCEHLCYLPWHLNIGVSLLQAIAAGSSRVAVPIRHH